MAEDEIIKHTKAVYEAWNNQQKSWTHKLKEILVEILIIVFAVSVSIWLHNWSESLKDRKLEKEFLTGLKEDIQADIKEMMNDRASLEKSLQGIHYFEKVGGGEILNKDSLNKYMQIFFSTTQIDPRISRFEALKGSGKLDIIENKKLLYNIIDLYQKNFPQIFRLNQDNNSLTVDKIDPFIQDHSQLDAQGRFTNAQDVLRIPKMRMLIFSGEGIQNNVNAYSVGIDKSNEIIKQIDEELK